MRFNVLIVAFITFLLSSTLLSASQYSNDTQPYPGFIPNLPPGEEFEAPPEPIVEIPPVYLDVDSKGNVYRIKAIRDELGNYEISHELISQKTLDEIRSQQDVVLKNMENIGLPGESSSEGSSTASTSSCPLPSNFSIVANEDGEAVGFAKVADTNRPPEATTQWIVFDFFTRGYRLAGSHMPIALFHEDTMHGWGSFIGDNHDSPVGCGASSRFNSQIEGWIQYGTPPQPPSSTWQSHTFSSSCGNEMYDGPVMIVPGFLHVPRYRMEMHSSTGHWVAYRIWEWKLSLYDWEVLTEWTALDVDTGNWAFPPPIFNNAAEGIFIFATDGNPIPWQIHIYSTQCGWF